MGFFCIHKQEVQDWKEYLNSVGAPESWKTGPAAIRLNNKFNGRVVVKGDFIYYFD